MCYCKKYFDLVDYLKVFAEETTDEMMDSLEGFNIVKSIEDKSIHQFKEESLKFCSDYNKDQNYALFRTNLVTFLVTGINYVITHVNINLVGMIGFDTRSKVTSGIMTSITIAQVVNTAIITLLTNADFSYVFP
jgi:hypothetical protein